MQLTLQPLEAISVVFNRLSYLLLYITSVVKAFINMYFLRAFETQVLKGEQAEMQCLAEGHRTPGKHF